MTVISLSVSIRKVYSYYKYLITFLQSLKENSGVDNKIIIWEEGLDYLQKKNIKKIWNNLEYREIDIGLYEKYGKTLPMWYCLEAFKLSEYDKVISMDCDFVCNGEIGELLNQNVEMGMVKQNTGIFNGGLLVIGKKYLDGKWYKKLIESDHNNIHIGERDKWSTDQKLYNYYFEDIVEINPRYNALVSELDTNQKVEFARLIHYIYKPLYEGGSRQLDSINIELQKLWYKYFEMAVKTIEN